MCVMPGTLGGGVPGVVQDRGVPGGYTGCTTVWYCQAQPMVYYLPTGAWGRSDTPTVPGSKLPPGDCSSSDLADWSRMAISDLEIP